MEVREGGNGEVMSLCVFFSFFDRSTAFLRKQVLPMSNVSEEGVAAVKNAACDKLLQVGTHTG